MCQVGCSKYGSIVVTPRSPAYSGRNVFPRDPVRAKEYGAVVHHPPVVENGPSKRVPSSHLQHLPRNPSRLPRREEHNGVRNVGGCADSAQGYRGHNALLELCRQQAGLNRAGSHCIHRDPKRSKLDRGASRKCLQRSLARSIAYLSRERSGRIRTDIDDAAVRPTALLMTPHELTSKEYRCARIDGKVP